MAIKYKALKDRLPKQDGIDIELPSGAVLKFHSPLNYKDGELFDVMDQMDGLEREGAKGIQSIIDKLAVEPAKMRKTLKDEEGLVDADTFGIFQAVGEEFGKQMGSVGESKG